MMYAVNVTSMMQAFFLVVTCFVVSPGNEFVCAFISRHTMIHLRILHHCIPLLVAFFFSNACTSNNVILQHRWICRVSCHHYDVIIIPDPVSELIHDFSSVNCYGNFLPYSVSYYDYLSVHDVNIIPDPVLPLSTVIITYFFTLNRIMIIHLSWPQPFCQQPPYLTWI